MFVLPLPLENTVATLEQSEGSLAKPQLYVVVNGIPTKKKLKFKLLPGCPTGCSGGCSMERVWWQVVWYQALSSEYWPAESSQDGQEEER